MLADKLCENQRKLPPTQQKEPHMSRLRTIVIAAVALALVSIPTAASAADSWLR